MCRPELVDDQMIADRLGVPVKTVYQWRHRQVLPPADYPALTHSVWLWSTIRRWAEATGRIDRGAH
jgi:hypothetical protein